MQFLSDYKTFNDTQELNHHVKQHVNEHYYDMNDTEREVLYLISRYAVKHAGVAMLKVKTIADALDKSERTIYRVISKLSALNVIERINTTREKTGGQGANIYRILPHGIPSLSYREDSAKPTQTKAEHVENTDETINLLSYSNNTSDTREQVTAEQVIHESIHNNTPDDIVGLLSPFFYGSELYKYVGIVFKAKYRPHVNIRIESHLNAFKACIYDVIRRHKGGRIHNLEAYMFTSIKALARRLYMGVEYNNAV